MEYENVTILSVDRCKIDKENIASGHLRKSNGIVQSLPLKRMLAGRIHMDQFLYFCMCDKESAESDLCTLPRIIVSSSSRLEDRSWMRRPKFVPGKQTRKTSLTGKPTFGSLCSTIPFSSNSSFQSFQPFQLFQESFLSSPLIMKYAFIRSQGKQWAIG